MRVVITGGAGFIGCHLARYHAARGDEAWLIDNFSKSGTADEEFNELARQPGITAVDADLTAQPEIELPPAVDVVYHLAAINGTQLFYERPYDVARTNVLVTVNLLDLLQRRGTRVGRLVYSSTSEIYAGAERYGLLRLPTDETVPAVFPQPLPARFSYGSSKFMGEVLCSQFGATHGVPWTVIRYHNIYGPRMGGRHVIPELIERIRKEQRPFELRGGHETRAFCYIDDAVKATALAAVTPACAGETVHVGNPEETRILDLAKLLMELLGFSAQIRELGSREGSVSRRCPDTAKLKRLTGFQAEVGLKAGVERTVEWYLAHA